MRLEDLENKLKIVSNNIRFPERVGEFDFADSGQVVPGSIALFEVQSNEGGYIEQLNLNGDKIRVQRGDYIAGVFGIRHSGTNISGGIPKEGLQVKRGELFQILSSSTIVGIVRRVPSHIGEIAIDVKLDYLLVNESDTINTRQLTPYEGAEVYLGETPIILGLGSSAECGKTTLVSMLISDLSELHLRVAASKTNGSGNIRDKYTMRDAGAIFFMDYVDFGFPTTYDVDERVYLKCLKGLLTEIVKHNPDVIILECGGDVMWGNIPAVLKDRQVNRNVVAGTMCSTDYMAAFGAYRYVRDFGLTFPVLFDVPIGKESFYRKGYFEELVGSKVYDIMVPDERKQLNEDIFRHVEKFRNGKH